MTELQKQIAREFLREAYSNGFGNSIAVAPIAEKVGVKPEEIYDDNTETGLMAEFSDTGTYGAFSFRRGYVSVSMDMRDLMENWCDFH